MLKLGRNRSGLLEVGIALLEHINAAFRIDHRLLTREIRMASRARVHLHLRLGGAGVDDIAARARDGGVDVIRMDTVFHYSTFPKIEPILYNILRKFASKFFFFFIPSDFTGKNHRFCDIMQGVGVSPVPQNASVLVGPENYLAFSMKIW